MIGIIDYGMGNLGSILNMFKRIGAEAKIISDVDQIKAADKLILPGVGAFDAAMAALNERNLIDVVNQRALEDKIPVLGICLGMQLLTKGSEEGKLSGLGWIPAYTYKFKDIEKLKIPHMGWNEVEKSGDSKLTEGIENVSSDGEPARFYFVHSYYVKVEKEENSTLKANYGHKFDAAIQHNNIMGCQFHPEKSHRFGMQIFTNFVNI